MPMSGGATTARYQGSRLARPLAGQGQHRFQHVVDVDAAGFEHHVPRLDRGEVEDIVDQRQQLMRAVENAAAVVELARIQRRRNTGWSEISAKPMIAFSGVRSS